MTDSTSRRRPPAFVLALLVAAAVVGLQALLVALFAAPAANLEPRDVPVVVAGPDPAAARFAGELESARPGAFDVTVLADQAAADAALRDHEAYAAFVLGASGPTLRTASAASPSVAAALTEAASQFAGRPVPVVDVVPTDPDDPHGAGFASGFLPLTMTSLVAGTLLAFLVRRRGARVLGLVAYAAFAGAVGATVLQSWLGVLPGDFLANAAAIGLFALAASGIVTGLTTALGAAGLGLGTLLVFLVGNPLSGVAAAPELLPRPWGEVGQWLPAGAGGTLLRSVAYFDGAGGGRPVWVLTGYAVLGLALALFGRARIGPAPAAEPPGAGRTGGTAAAPEPGRGRPAGYDTVPGPRGDPAQL
jgi:hypothetical protein